MVRGLTFWVILWLMLHAPLAAQQTAFPPAASYQTTSFVTQRGGVDVSLMSHGYDAYGYTPLEVMIEAGVVTAADRTFVVELRFSTFGDRSSITTTCELDLPAGERAARKHILLAHLTEWDRQQVDLWCDGQRAKSAVPNNSQVYPIAWNSQPIYARHSNVNTQNYSLWPHDDLPRILIISKLPQNKVFQSSRVNSNGEHELIGLFDIETYVQGAPGLPINERSRTLDAMALLAPGELHEGWLNLVTLDVIAIDWEELAELQKSQPKVFQSLRDWAYAGGNLWVWGVGDDWSQAGALEKLLGASPQPLPQLSDKNLSEMFSDAWRLPSDKMYLSIKEQPDPNNSGQTQEVLAVSTPPHPAHFIYRNFGLGQLVAVGPKNALGDGTAADWAWICNTSAIDRLLWTNRFGFGVNSENSDFWNFLIPGVGLPPIGTYRVLITLFVIFIGPVNYLLLRKWRRLHLLLFTVPATAGVIALALMGYALISDGLGTRIRVRSFTRLDQRTGVSSSWSRLSYYAGLKPSEGMTFANDTAVFPLEHEPENRYRPGSGHQRTMNWGAEQRLSEGWLDARQPTQFLTVRSGPTPRKLKIEQDAAGAPSQVENNLGGRVRLLMLTGDAGQIYSARDLGQGAKQPLKPHTATDQVEIMIPIREAMNLHKPDFPEGWNSSNSGPFGFRNRYYYYNTSSMSMTSSRMERSFDEAYEACGDLQPAPRTYLAVVERFPEVALGLPHVKEVDSFYIIVGKW